MTPDRQEQSLAALLGIDLPDAVEFGGKAYPLRGPTVEEQKRFAKWTASRALAEIESRADILTPDQLKAHRALWQEEVAAGKWNYYSPACVTSLQELCGRAKLLSMILLPEYPECTPDYVERMLWDQCAGLVYAAAEGAAAGDPKAAGLLERVRNLFGETTTPTPSPSGGDSATTTSGA